MKRKTISTLVLQPVLDGMAPSVVCQELLNRLAWLLPARGPSSLTWGLDFTTFPLLLSSSVAIIICTSPVMLARLHKYQY